MKLEDLAVRVFEAAEAENVEFMAVGAIAAGGLMVCHAPPVMSICW